jgi:nicotinate-nucleotide--dimethylbenzimidazole phosphoribosyltransferase
MADEIPGDTASDHPVSEPAAEASQPASQFPFDPRYSQRNFAERLFPGPTKQMSEAAARRIEGLIKDGGNDAALQAWREAQARRSRSEERNGAADSRRRGPGRNEGRDAQQATEAPAIEAPSIEAPATEAPASQAPSSLLEVDPTELTERLDQQSDKLEQQNELLRAILASSVDTQTDARATAQNSRTFAWAGTAIALLTLIATIISIVAAIRA